MQGEPAAFQKLKACNSTDLLEGAAYLGQPVYARLFTSVATDDDHDNKVMTKLKMMKVRDCSSFVLERAAVCVTSM